MTRAGIPVPPGFVILASAHEAFKKEGKMPAEVAGEIRGAFKKLDAKRVAVRSSATAEDGKDASWAGQLESYLNTTEENLLENVEKCWQSLFTPRVVAYRSEQGLAEKDISVAVVVQKMVEAEIAGVAFSVHPVTEDRNQMIIEAVAGLGEALVSGQITPDSYVVAKDSLELVDVTAQGEQKLSEQQIKELAELVIKIEDCYGFPVDVEWAYAGGRFYIVQSRRITTLSSCSAQTKIIAFARKAKKQFARDYQSDTTLFCLYDSFKFSYPQVIGTGFSDILIYKNKKNSEFYLLTEESALLEDLVEEKMKTAFIKEVLKEFSEKVKEIKTVLAREKHTPEDTQKLFALNSELSPLERVMFLVPHLVIEHGAKIADSALIARYQEARQKNEHLSYAIDAFFKQQETCIPTYLTRYKKDLREFIIFNDTVIYQGEDFEEVTKILKTKEERTKDKKTIEGSSACAGKVRGTVTVVLSRSDYKKIKNGDILVTPNTNPDFVSVIKEVAAIVTDEGGITCHAAIVAREMKIPCIVGTKVATQILKTGDLIEVDATNGIVRIIKKAQRV